MTETTNEALLRSLLALVPEDAAEQASLEAIRDFVSRHPDPFDRRIPEGHLTGSALVVSVAGEVLLLHHRRLDRWLQPGGHAEPGESEGERVALREAEEETGLEGLHLHPSAPRPLDVDVHVIPERKGEPSHLHLDLRYLAVAPEGATLSRSEEETSDLRWFTFAELASMELDAGLLRALSKVRRLVGG